MATPQRTTGPSPRYGEAQAFLSGVKATFVDRPAVYQEILNNLNQVWRATDAVGCVARVEALLATSPSVDLLRQFRGFLPSSAAEAWQRSAPPPDPAAAGKGEGSAREPITFESDDDAAAPAAEDDTTVPTEADAVDAVAPAAAPAAGDEAAPTPAGNASDAAAAPAPSAETVTGTADDAADDSDDEVVLVSTNLINPSVDLPHARHDCATLGMPERDGDDAEVRALARRFCPKCYCALCGRPASDCSSWPEHSRYRDEARWRAVRDALIAVPAVPEPAPRRFKRARLRRVG
jgi:hypothetical protein